MKKIKKTPSVLIYGGSFSPIHWGHVRAALHVQKHMHFDEFLFLPCKAPLLDKVEQASCDARVAMLSLALNEYPRFKVDLTEIQRETPSYMVDTLFYFRAKRGWDVSISVLLGEDSFVDLTRWSRWELLLELAHLVVMERPSANPIQLDGALKRLLFLHQTRFKTDVLTEPFGKIYRLNAGDFPISSTTVRDAIAKGVDIATLVPPSVAAYIYANALYS